MLYLFKSVSISAFFAVIFVTNSYGLIISAYKDVGINANWNSSPYEISTLVTVSHGWEPVPLLSVLPAKADTVTWAFATGECGQENWAGIPAQEFADKNIASFVKKNTNYIVSTGGAAGTFTCSTHTGMDTFLKRYNSSNLIGLDLDIESGQTAIDIDNLIREIVYAKSKLPYLRISFTLATLAASDGSEASLNSTGEYVVAAAKKAGLNFIINLMTMDYGDASPSVCVVKNGSCEMYDSAVQAVINLKNKYHIDFQHIEVTPIIGNNDSVDEFFTLENAYSLAQYAKQNNLAGLHFWSFDRDTPCLTFTTGSTNTCSSDPFTKTKPLDFLNAFISVLP